MVYLRPKGKRSENGKLIHVAKEGETLHSISQTYGIRLKNLCNMNRRTPDSEVKAGPADPVDVTLFSPRHHWQRRYNTLTTQKHRN